MSEQLRKIVLLNEYYRAHGGQDAQLDKAIALLNEIEQLKCAGTLTELSWLVLKNRVIFHANLAIWATGRTAQLVQKLEAMHVW
jgi:hypothetical protein